MKSIIIYYSRSGNTEKLAKQIQNDLQSDVLKVEPKKAYGNYISALFRVIGEKMSKKKPEFITQIPDLKDYDTILIGTPIWAYSLPVFLSEFISQCDLKGKKVIPFATFGGSGVKGAVETLEEICKGAELVLPFGYGISKKDNYEEWMTSIKKL